MNKSVFIQTVIVSVIFFIVLFSVSYIDSLAPNDGGIKMDPTHVFIALMPFIFLLVASGKLKEIKGPGGIALLMKDEAEREISVEAEGNALDVDPEIVHSKEGFDSLAHMVRENPPTALTFMLMQKNYYIQYAIEEYLRKLTAFSTFKTIVFVSADGHFSGYMKVDDFSMLVGEGGVVELLESGDILRDKRVITQCIGNNSSNRETLSKMEKSNINEMAVIDSKGRFIGLINQEKIVRKILSKLVREA